MKVVYCVFMWSDLGDNWVLEYIFESKEGAKKYINEQTDERERKIIQRYLR